MSSQVAAAGRALYSYFWPPVAPPEAAPPSSLELPAVPWPTQPAVSMAVVVAPPAPPPLPPCSAREWRQQLLIAEPLLTSERRAEAEAARESFAAEPALSLVGDPCTWRRLSGPTSLFGAAGVPQVQHVRQGLLRDCSVLAPFASAVARAPHFVASGFRDLGLAADGTRHYRVRFFHRPPGASSAQPVWVAVDDRFLLTASEVTPCAKLPRDEATGARVTYVALWEKAFAKFNDRYDVLSFDTLHGMAPERGLARLHHGGLENALPALTGRSAALIDLTMNPEVPTTLEHPWVPHQQDRDVLSDLPSRNARFAVELLQSGRYIGWTTFKAPRGDGVLPTLADGTRITADTVLERCTPEGVWEALRPDHAYALLRVTEDRVDYSALHGEAQVRSMPLAVFMQVARCVAVSALPSTF